MDPFALFIGFGLLAGAVLFVVSPLRLEVNDMKSSGKETARSGRKIPREQQRTQERESVLLALRDLDFDYQAGKIAEADYNPLRTELLGEAAALITDQDRFQEQARLKDDAIEALIHSRRNGKLEQQPATKRMTRVSEKAPDSIEAPDSLAAQCQHCQASLADGAKFCSKCGTSVAEAPCPNCQHAIQPGDRFCPACGSAILTEN